MTLLILSGNVDVSAKYRGSNDSVSFKLSSLASTLDHWKNWALASQNNNNNNNTPTIVQLVRPGRQSPGVIQEFVGTAKLAYEAGFKGGELHGAHGYLLSHFYHQHPIFAQTPTVTQLPSSQRS
jgi:hypothetical protein